MLVLISSFVLLGMTYPAYSEVSGNRDAYSDDEPGSFHHSKASPEPPRKSPSPSSNKTNKFIVLKFGECYTVVADTENSLRVYSRRRIGAKSTDLQDAFTFRIFSMALEGNQWWYGIRYGKSNEAYLRELDWLNHKGKVTAFSENECKEIEQSSDGETESDEETASDLRREKH